MDVDAARASLRAYYSQALPGADRTAVEAATEAALAAMVRGADAATANAAGQAEAARLRADDHPVRAAAPTPARTAPTTAGAGGTVDTAASRRPLDRPATPTVAPRWANDLAVSLFAAPARWGWRAAPPPAPVAPVAPLSGSRPVWVEAPGPDTSQLRATVAKAKSRHVRRLVFGTIFTVLTVGILLPIVLILVISASRAKRLALANLHNFEQPYLALRAAELQRHDHALKEWDEAVRRHREEVDQAAREEAARANGPLWFPVQPSGEPTRLDVFGGDSQRHGWSSLLATLGTSILAAGGRITVLDFTGMDVGGGLLGVAQARRMPTRSLALGGGTQVDLIGGMSPHGIVDSLAYAVTGHHATTDLRQERALATQALGTVIQCLDGQVTLARLSAGIRVLLRADSTAGLTAQEVTNLAGHMGDIDQNEWTTRQLRFLANQLNVLSAYAPAGGYAPSLWSRDAVSLIVTPGGRDDRKDLLDRLLVQLAQQTMDGDRWAGGFLVVAGADHLGAETLANLSDHARHAGVRLALLIDQPQGEMEKNAGTGGAVCIMKMYNHRDATVAAEFIGKGYTFVVNQITRQTGKTLTDGGGDNFAATTNQGGGSKQKRSGRPGRENSLSDSRGHTWSATRNWSTADNLSSSTASARVYEFVVDPQEILGMPETAFILIDSSGQGRRVIMADGNPGISLLPRVSRNSS